MKNQTGKKSFNKYENDERVESITMCESNWGNEYTIYLADGFCVDRNDGQHNFTEESVKEVNDMMKKKSKRITECECQNCFEIKRFGEVQ